MKQIMAIAKTFVFKILYLKFKSLYLKLKHQINAQF